MQADVKAPAAPALLDALATVLAPLVRMSLAHGIEHPLLDDALLRCYVQVAQAHFLGQGERASASRIDLLTGIHRKKINALKPARPPLAEARPALHRRVLDGWTGNPALLDAKGRPRVLALTRRAGGERSFEALVESVSRDVRPRAALDTLLNTGRVVMVGAGRVKLVSTLSRGGGRGRDGDGVALERLLRPMTEAVVHNQLRTGARCSASAVQVRGLSAAEARRLTDEWRRLSEALLYAFNDKAERRAAAERQARRGGGCTVQVGVCEWTAGLEAAAPLTMPLPRVSAAPGPSPAAPPPAPPGPRRPGGTGPTGRRSTQTPRR
jgi:hypothetical protein